MPAAAEPAPGLALSNFMELPVIPADDTPKDGSGAPTPAPDKTGNVAIEEPPIKPLVDDDDDPEKGGAPDDGDGKPKDDKPDDDAPQSLESAMRDGPAITKQSQDKAAAEKKAKDDAEAAKNQTDEEKKKAEADAANQKANDQRDSDLKYEPAAHTHPKTRTVITKFQTAAKAARDERDRIVAEKAALQKERDELADKVKAGPVPKEIEDEVKTLRERVRELDITKDPILEAKYDRRIESNNKTIVDVLKAQGYGMVKGEGDKMVENPKAIAELVKSGLTLKNLTPLIKKLEEAELIDEAEAIREAVRNNNRLSQEKTQEIESWKGDYSKRQQAREQQSKQHVEARQQEYTRQTDTQYRAAIETLAKDFSYLKQPPAPLATDTPAVKTAKEAAIADYNAAASKIEAEVKGLNPEGMPAEKQTEVIGRINANAILAITLKNQVLPRVMKDLQARDARIKELETELNAIKGAGRLSRLQGSTPGDNPNNGQAQPESLEAAFRMVQPGNAQG